MKVLGIDYGEKRIGLSFGDSLGIATPLPAATAEKPSARLAFLEALIRDRQIDRIVVGMPYNMDGSRGFKAREVEAFISELKARFNLPITTVDERLTTHQVEEELKQQNRKIDRRSGEIDSRAATLILHDFLDLELGQTLNGPDETDL